MGSNTITAVGVDPFGNEASDSVVVIYTGGCPWDAYEEDNDLLEAREFNLASGNPFVPEQHAFHLQSDQDWLKLIVRPGARYELATSDLETLADTRLRLYAGDGATLLAENDDADMDVQYSRIVWTAPLTPEHQTVYLVASQTAYNTHDCNTGYTLAITQTVGGAFDDTTSAKAVDPALADLEVDDPVTYTIALVNTDPLQAAAPVTVTDTLPTTITLQSAEVCEPSTDYATYQLLTTTRAFTWVGAVGPSAQVSLCVNGTVAITPWTSINTAWIMWNTSVISVSVKGETKPFSGVYLPIILKNQ